MVCVFPFTEPDVAEVISPSSGPSILLIALAVGGASVLVFVLLSLCVYKRFKKLDYEAKPLKRVLILQPNSLYADYHKEHSGNAFIPLVPQVSII